jgi:hypothetical protein
MAATNTAKRRSPYAPGHQRSDDPYSLDDTLDAHPPYHLLCGQPTPEAMEAARRLAAERGYPPRFPPDAERAESRAIETRSVNGDLPERRTRRTRRYPKVVRRTARLRQSLRQWRADAPGIARTSRAPTR